MSTLATSPKLVVYMPFTGAMVLALGRDIDPKTETRRTMKKLPKGQYYNGADENNAHLHSFGGVIGKKSENSDSMICPYGQPGTQIWVKESAWMWCHKKADGLTGTGRAKWRYIPVGQHVIYCADHPQRPTTRIDDAPQHEWRLKVGRFLPGWGIRTKLEIVSLHAERLHEISEADALAEGVAPSAVESFARVKGVDRPAGFAYRDLWKSINGEGSWELNPMVWVIKFKRISQAIQPVAGVLIA
jgi:hypothetical protein